MPNPKTKSAERMAAGIKAANKLKWRNAQRRAARTAVWATTMSKWLITHSTTGKAWQVVGFLGRARGESAGVVDLIATRRNYSASSRGDLFEMLFIQVKGGGARPPTLADVERLKRAATHHRATAVILCEWKQGERLVVSRLRRCQKPKSVRDAWVPITDAAAFFSSPRARVKRGASLTRTAR